MLKLVHPLSEHSCFNQFLGRERERRPFPIYGNWSNHLCTCSLGKLVKIYKYLQLYRHTKYTGYKIKTWKHWIQTRIYKIKLRIYKSKPRKHKKKTRKYKTKNRKYETKTSKIQDKESKTNLTPLLSSATWQRQTRPVILVLNQLWKFWAFLKGNI